MKISNLRLPYMANKDGLASEAISMRLSKGALADRQVT
jgi:hypothetical protein